MHRHGSLSVDISGALAGLALLMLIVAIAAGEHRELAHQEQHAAALETAQNMLAQYRGGENPSLPNGWSITRRDVANHFIQVTISSKYCSLSTLLPAQVRP